MMGNRAKWGVAIGTVLLVGALGRAGMAYQGLGGAAQEIKKGAGRIGEGIKHGAEEVGDSLREGFQKARASVHGMGVEARVYSRIHWDKDLVNAPIELERQGDSTIILKGSVPDQAARTKALTLARDTAGVTSVVDSLAIAPVSATTTTKTTTTKTTIETKKP